MSAAFGSFLTALGEGAGDYGQLQHKGTIDALNDEAEMMKAQRLMSLEETQLATSNMFKMANLDMNQQRLDMSKSEAARAEEKYQYQKGLRGAGTWENKTIYPYGKLVKDDLGGAPKWIKGQGVEVQINSVTGEVRRLDLPGTITGGGTVTGERKHFTGTKSEVEAWLANQHLIRYGYEGTKDRLAKMWENGEKNNAFTVTDGTTTTTTTTRTDAEKSGQETDSLITSAIEIGKALTAEKGLSEVDTQVDTFKDYSSDAWRKNFNQFEDQIAIDLGIKAGDITQKVIKTLKETLTDENVAEATKSIGVSAVHSLVSNMVDEGKTQEEIIAVLESKGYGSNLSTEQKDAYRTVLQIVRKDGLKRYIDTTDNMGALKDTLSDFWNRGILEDPIVKYWVDKIKGIDVDSDSIRDTLREWDKNDIAKIAEIIGESKDAVKKQIEKITAGLPVGEQVLPSLTKPVPKPYPNQDGLILPAETGSSIDDARKTAMATSQAIDLPAATELPPELPPEILAGEMPTGSLTDGPLDEVIISQMPYDSLVTLFNNAQEMVSVGGGKEEAEILFTNMELIKSELRTREPPAATPELPPELPIGFGQDDPRIDDGQSLLDTKVLLDPTQMHRRIDYSRGRQGEGGLSMDADYRTLPGTFSRAHGQDDPQEAGTMNRAEIKALLDPTQRHRQQGIIEATEPTDLLLGASYDPNLEQGVKTLQQIAKESGEEIGTSEIVLKKIMPDITKFVDKVKKAVADDASNLVHTKLLRGIEASYYKVADEISKDNYLKVLTAEMEKAGVADRKPGDFLFKYSTAVIGTLVDGVKWIDENVPTLYKPSGEVLHEKGTATKKITEAGYRKKDEEQQALVEPPAETNILKMNYNESIENIRTTVKRLHDQGMETNEVIDQLFKFNGVMGKQEGFNKTDYSKALNDVMIGLHTTPEKYK